MLFEATDFESIRDAVKTCPTMRIQGTVSDVIVKETRYGPIVQIHFDGVDPEEFIAYSDHLKDSSLQLSIKSGSRVEVTGYCSNSRVRFYAASDVRILPVANDGAVPHNGRDPSQQRGAEPAPDAETILIVNHLKQIALAAMMYEMDHPNVPVRLQELVAGGFVGELNPVRGEVYDDILIAPDAESITVTDAEGRVYSARIR